MTNLNSLLTSNTVLEINNDDTNSDTNNNFYLFIQYIKNNRPTWYHSGQCSLHLNYTENLKKCMEKISVQRNLLLI